MAEFVEVGDKIINLDRICFAHVSEEALFGTAKKQTKVVINFEDENSIDFNGEKADEILKVLRGACSV
ncbi:MAG: hypothetical protein ABSA46_19110 [Thermodesulfovibrionales bacterium]|jgi:hypothetical protein